MNLLELQISATDAVDRRWRKREPPCPRCQKALHAFGQSDHYVCVAGHQFTAKQLFALAEPTQLLGT